MKTFYWFNDVVISGEALRNIFANVDQSTLPPEVSNPKTCPFDNLVKYSKVCKVKQLVNYNGVSYTQQEFRKLIHDNIGESLGFDCRFCSIFRLLDITQSYIINK